MAKQRNPKKILEKLKGCGENLGMVGKPEILFFFILGLKEDG